MGYADEDFGATLRVRKTSPALRLQIGEFFVAWSVVEGEMDTAFPVLFRLDPTLAMCIYANLGTRQKIDILTSAVDMLHEALGFRRARATHAILDQIRTLNDLARNTLAHGHHENWTDEDTGKNIRAVVRYVARKQLMAVVHPANTKHWCRMTKAALATAARLRKKIDSLYTHLKTFSEEEIWDATGFQDKPARRVVFRRRRPPLPKRSGTQARLSKPGKPKRTS